MRKPRQWIWDDIRSWETELWKLVSSTISRPVIDQFKLNPPQYIVGDDLSWLDDTVHETTGQYIDSKTMMMECICNRYDTIRAYHGTRALDVSSFYKLGLLPLDMQSALQRAQDIFLTGEFPELTQEHLRQALSDEDTSHREGRIFFALNKDDLVRDCSSYMLYGSELQILIATRLGDPKYLFALKRRGTPTVFACDVPLDMLPDHDIAGIAGSTLAIMFERVLDNERGHPQGGEGGGLEIKKALPAKYIVSHFHPTQLFDFAV